MRNFRLGAGSQQLADTLEALDTRLTLYKIVSRMKAISYTEAREKLAATMDQVCRDRDPVIITRKRDQAVVMLSLEDYDALKETAHLLRAPANARRLLAAIQSLESGGGIERELIDRDDE